MLYRFRQFIEQNDLFSEEDSILLAVSGGMDSTAMVRLFREAGYSFGIAHCNFKLRGEASAGDEEFVRAHAAKMQVPFFGISFDTENYAKENKLSIQLAARELRYQWLEKTRKTQSYDYIATAHQLNDSIETVFYNFTKGCGIRGLHGIPRKSGLVIRPLLFAAKEDLLAFIKEKGISFREDASNAEDKYARNNIRHHVIPVLKELNPGFEHTVSGNLEHIRDAELLYDYAIAKIRGEVFDQDERHLKINLNRLLEFPAAGTVLYELLRPFNFHSGQVRQILENPARRVGALFYSHTHQLLIDRNSIIIEKRQGESGQAEYLIDDKTRCIDLPEAQLSINWKEGIPDKFPADNKTAFLDAAKLIFPLRLRHWQKGDYFLPLGMKGHRQKLQDLFTHLKLSRFDKNRVWLLETADGNICWVVGYRIDERYKIKPGHKGYVVLNFRKV